MPARREEARVAPRSADPADDIFGKYQGWTNEARDAAVENAKTGEYANVWLQLKAGDFKQVRMIPAESGDPLVIVWKHTYEDETGRWGGGPCRVKMYNERCDHCDYSNSLRRSIDKDDQDAGFKASAKKRFIVKVLERATGLVKLWEGSMPMSKMPNGRTQFEMLMRCVNGAQPFDPTLMNDDGRDLILGREGEKRNTQYSVEAAREMSPLAETVDEMKEILAMADAIDIDTELNRTRAVREAESRTQAPAHPTVARGALPARGEQMRRARSTAADLADEDGVIDADYTDPDDVGF